MTGSSHEPAPADLPHFLLEHATLAWHISASASRQVWSRWVRLARQLRCSSASLACAASVQALRAPARGREAVRRAASAHEAVHAARPGRSKSKVRPPSRPVQGCEVSCSTLAIASREQEHARHACAHWQRMPVLLCCGEDCLLARLSDWADSFDLSPKVGS
jgi:hypothetical protein